MESNPTFSAAGLVQPPAKVSTTDAYKALRTVCTPECTVFKAGYIEATFKIYMGEDLPLQIYYSTLDIINATGEKTFTVNAGQDNEREKLWHESDLWHGEWDQAILLAVADYATGFIKKEARNG